MEITNNKKRIILIALMLLAVMGFLDSLVIYQKAFGNVYLPCVIGSGCDTVLFSSYSKLFGISVSLWGAGFYLFLAAFLALAFIFEKKLFIRIGLGLIAAGFTFSLYLLYLQMFKIEVLCTYCMISFSIITASVILALFLARQKRQG
jgi:uncharacterized membrane protein